MFFLYILVIIPISPVVFFLYIFLIKIGLTFFFFCDTGIIHKKQRLLTGMSKNLAELAACLKVQRALLKMKGKDVAEKLEISAAYYSKIECCTVTPTVEICAKLSEVLHIPLAKLLVLSGQIPEDIMNRLSDLYIYFGSDVKNQIDKMIIGDNEVIS